MPLAETWITMSRELALKADQALRDGQPLVLESEHEKRAIRSYAEREYSYWKSHLEYQSEVARIRELRHDTA